MRNLNLQGVTNHPHLFLPLEGGPEDLTNNYLLSSRDGKSIIAVTFREIDDELPVSPNDGNKKYVHFSISLIDKSVKIYLYCRLASSKYINIPYSIKNMGYSLPIHRTS